VLLAEQDITLAQRCADRAYVLRRGRIVAQMSPQQLHDHDRLRELYLGAPEVAATALH
jgi:ABC-type branched-subunit amino acid transport system ATPase component